MDDEVAESVPLLTMSTPHIGHFQIRTRGTLGGAIAHADPAAEYAAVALTLDAVHRGHVLARAQAHRRHRSSSPDSGKPPLRPTRS